MSIIFKLEEGKLIKLELEELEKLENYDNSLGKTFFYNEYVLKVFPINPITENIIGKFKFLNKKISSINDNFKNLKKFVFYRSIPLSFFIDAKNVLRFLPQKNKNTQVERSVWFIFSKIEGISLGKYLENESPFSQKRINIAEKIINIVNFCNKQGIIINDIYQDNFIIDKDMNVYILDLYKCGILNEDDFWEWEPIISIKEELFYPPETILKQKINKNIENWALVYLIFWILTGLKPFDFLPQNNHKNLETFILNIDKSIVTWPPLITTFQESSKKIISSKTIKKEKYEIFRNLCNELDNEDIKAKIFELSFNTFIKGYLDHNYRFSAEQIKNFLFKSSIKNTEFSEFGFPSTQTKENIENLIEDKDQKEQKKEEEIKVKPQTVKKQETNKEKSKIIKNLPISTREYITKIIQQLEKTRLYNKEVEKNIEEIIKKQQIDLVINVFISTRDLNTVLWLIYIMNTEYWESLFNQLTKLSEILNISIYKVIEQKVVPILYKNQNIEENYKEILNQVQLEILRETKKQNDIKIKNLTNIFLITISIIFFLLPFILFFVFKIKILYIILLYPVLFSLSMISSKVLIKQ